MLRPSVANCIGSVKVLVKSSCVIVSIKFIKKTGPLGERRPPPRELNPDHSQYIFHGS